jgi:hypothetical protein
MVHGPWEIVRRIANTAPHRDKWTARQDQSSRGVVSYIGGGPNIVTAPATWRDKSRWRFGDALQNTIASSRRVPFSIHMGRHTRWRVSVEMTRWVARWRDGWRDGEKLQRDDVARALSLPRLTRSEFSMRGTSCVTQRTYFDANMTRRRKGYRAAWRYSGGSAARESRPSS